MVRITDDLLLSRAEHNDGNLPTLEEISLHQQHLEKIEYINRVCADLKILQFQVWLRFHVKCRTNLESFWNWFLGQLHRKDRKSGKVENAWISQLGYEQHWKSWKHWMFGKVREAWFDFELHWWNHQLGNPPT